MTGLFKLRGTLDERTKVGIEIAGVVGTLAIWTALVAWKLVPATILPMPWKVLTSLKELHYQDALIVNAMYSIKINFLGYLQAVGLALPLGMAIGLLPVFRALSERLIGAARYLPLTATIGIFIALSWTYIVFTEVINASDGGIGALAYIAARQSRPDKVYAVLLTIILIGFVQDKVFLSLGKLLFPFKYVEGGGHGGSSA